MADNYKHDKKHKKKVVYQQYPQIIPVGIQPVVYPAPITDQGNGVYAMHPQPYAMPMAQPVKRIPGQPNQIIAVPVGPPMTYAQPIGTPVMVPSQPVGAPPQAQPVVQTPYVAPQQQQKPPIIIIKKYHRKNYDCCCTIF